MASFVSIEICEFVLFGANMAACPVKFDWKLIVQTISCLNHVEVFDGAGFFGPAASFPSWCPDSKDVDPKLRIGVDFTTVGAGVFHSGDEGGALHADVSGV